VKVRQLNDKINTLYTTLENTKTDLSFLQQQQKGLSQEKEVMLKDIDILKLKLQQKEDAMHDKEKEIKDENVKLKQKQDELDDLGNEM
jgi:chromosome segregation ATPase